MEKTESVLASRRKLKREAARFFISFAAVAVLLAVFGTVTVHAATFSVDLGSGVAEEGSGILDVLLLFAILALLPSLLVMMTSFTRIIIVLSFLRNALGTQQSPPNQVLVGIALVLTLFIMTPTLERVNTEAYEPYRQGQVDGREALQLASVPIKEFMVKQIKTEDLNLFLTISGEELDQSQGESLEALTALDMKVIMPAFITSELKKAFFIGFYIFLPFLIIDIVVSSTLMSMGMMMLPPSMISLPFKIMTFVLVDGWERLFSSLVSGFH